MRFSANKDGGEMAAGKRPAHGVASVLGDTTKHQACENRSHTAGDPTHMCFISAREHRKPLLDDLNPWIECGERNVRVKYCECLKNVAAGCLSAITGCASWLKIESSRASLTRRGFMSVLSVAVELMVRNQT